MKSSYTDGSPTVNRICPRTEEDRSSSSDRAQVASAEPPTEVQGPRYRLSCAGSPGRDECKDGDTPSDPKHQAPPARDPAWQVGHAVPLGTLPSPPRAHSALRPPRRKERAEQLCCWTQRRADPLLFRSSDPPPPPPPQRQGKKRQLCQDALSTSHGSSQPLRGDSRSGDD